MTTTAILDLFEKWGQEGVRRVNAKNGAGDNQSGVVLSQLRTLAKQLKQNHPLGLELWATGQVEAMLLATLILKPKALTADQLNSMIRDVSYFKIADWLVTHTVRHTPHAAAMAFRWKDAEQECAGRAGWSLLSDLIKTKSVPVEPLLAQIDLEMKQAPLRKQESMNYCLVEIAVTHPEFRERALEIGHRLEVLKDYSVPKGCTSPFAPVWIAYLLSKS